MCGHERVPQREAYLPTRGNIHTWNYILYKICYDTCPYSHEIQSTNVLLHVSSVSRVTLYNYLIIYMSNFSLVGLHRVILTRVHFHRCRIVQCLLRFGPLYACALSQTFLYGALVLNWFRFPRVQCPYCTERTVLYT